MRQGTATHPSPHLRPGHRRLPRWIIAAGITTAMVSVTIAFSASFLEVYRLGREAARLERAKQALLDQNAALREEMRLLHTPAYIERIAREQLGLVKPGEVALIIVQPPPAASPRPPATPQPGWLARVWQTIVQLLRPVPPGN